MNRSLTVIALLLLPISVGAQGVRNIKGETTFVAPSSISLDEAKKIVVERARIQALADEFGTTIQTQTMTSMTNSGASSSVDMTSLSMSEVKGEWLGDTRDPVIKVLAFNLDGFTLQAEVQGRARQISSSKVDYEVKILRNGVTANCQSDTFHNGDDFYVLFRTPVSGYLAIYLMEDDAVYCLLPYRQDDSGLFKVDNRQEYVFFSPQNATKATAGIVDEYRLTSDKDVTFNNVFVIFSTTEFTKALDSANEASLRETTSAEFNRWLSRARARDSHMQVEQITIQIKK